MSTPGVLYIVATPIGNLEDMTFRAVRILGEVDLIAAEDTRHTRKLLTHYGISKPLTSYFDHNKIFKGGYILDRLRGGLSVALVTDAGTPCISDPGYQLVRSAVDEGIVVVPIPGPSAAIAALSASGLPTDSFVFLGFLPNRPGKRREYISAFRKEKRVVVLYEAPVRLMATLGDIRDLLGDRSVVVARELTKLHEEFVRGAVSEVIDLFVARRVQVRGEVVILVSPGSDEVQIPDAAQTQALLRQYLFDESLSLKDAVRRVVAELGLQRSEVYAQALLLKESQKD
ncbi:16S rRNA (cytidine(1402)-2'-O)-methyltransferase [Geobacter sp.]|uniref:16S rRNA (cytidine(1402)-2'-O)-methyltransferase n=1 Tax=Geobacter sp. TaxID=46610 RepID=UPI002629086E|nr:16S rRNA (cytidine(1402)-2'-O)-methyltransferase [Geobacter sp.]